MARSGVSAAAAAPARPRPSGGALRRLGRIADLRVLSMLVVFVLLCGVFHAASGGIFFTPRNLSLLLRQASIVAVVSAGVSILMIMGEIDLSIGSAVYLCSVVAATLQADYGVGTVPTVLVTVLAGIVMGAWQGVWVVRVAVPSFVVTLAGLLAFRGIGYYATDAATIAPLSDSFTDLSEGFVPPAASVVALGLLFLLAAGYMVRRHRAREREGAAPGAGPLLAGVLSLAAALGLLAWAFGGFRGIPMAVLWVAGTGLVLWVLMTRTRFGRNAYMIGSNREASLLAGIALGRQLFLGFVLMGVLYGVAGTLISARLSASTPSAGNYMELDAIASAVIGGTSLRGGVGTIPGAIAGAVLLATIDNGMSILNVSSFIQLIVKGLVLLFALAFDAYMIRHRTWSFAGVPAAPAATPAGKD
jgi:D-xylose transport system permease protein